MIKQEELREFRPVYRYAEGNDISLQTIQNAIKDSAMKYGIPVAFEADQIKSGGLLSKTVDDCLVVYHPEHPKDYYRVAISIKRQGTIAFVYANDFGTSKNLKKIAAKENAKASVAGGWKDWMTPGSGNGSDLVNGLIGGAFGALKGLGGSKAKQQEEDNYYAALMMILDEVIC